MCVCDTKLFLTTTSLSTTPNLTAIYINICIQAAHVKNVDARNADFRRIASELEATILGNEKEIGGDRKKSSRNSPSRPSQFFSSYSSSKKKNGGDDDGGDGDGDCGENLMKSMDHIFFCGDLNYRIDLPREVTEQKILEMRSIINSSSSVSNEDARVAASALSSSVLEDKEKEHLLATLRLDLLRHDQLLQQISEGRVFPNFTEGEIRFPPTFKFDKGSSSSDDSYDTSYKQRIPAWTDRILHRPFGVKVLEYDSVPTSTSSDHRPVYGTYLVDMVGRKRRRNDDEQKKDGDNTDDGSEKKMGRRKESNKRRISRRSADDANGSRRRTKSTLKNGSRRRKIGLSVDSGTGGSRMKTKKRGNRKP